MTSSDHILLKIISTQRYSSDRIVLVWMIEVSTIDRIETDIFIRKKYPQERNVSHWTKAASASIHNNLRIIIQKKSVLIILRQRRVAECSRILETFNKYIGNWRLSVLCDGLKIHQIGHCKYNHTTIML